MELPPAGLQGDDGAEGGLVPQDLPHYIHTHWLGLGKQTDYTTTSLCVVNKSYTGLLSELGHALRMVS